MIKEMLRQIRSELRDADKYGKCAKEYQEFGDLKQMYIDLAMGELSHAKTICDRTRAWVQDITRDNDDDGKYQFLWECESEMIDDDIASIMSTLNGIKGR